MPRSFLVRSKRVSSYQEKHYEDDENIQQTLRSDFSLGKEAEL